MDNLSRLLTFITPVILALLIRYFTIAGLAWTIFYKIKGKKIAGKKLQARWPKRKDYQREILYSLCSMAIFSLVAFSAFHPAIKPYTQIYKEPLAHGWGYLILSFFLTLIIHDTYFYWMHRALHHPKLFKAAHLIHHKSTNPTPFAALSFHPIEGFFEAAVIYLLVFTIPLNGWVLFGFMIFMFTYNVYGHLGWEIYPNWLRRSWVGRWLNTSTAHNAHHQYFEGNYGLYFLWWDKAMNTYRQE